MTPQNQLNEAPPSRPLCHLRLRKDELTISRSTIALHHSVAPWLIALLVLAGPAFGAESQNVASQHARKSPEWLTRGVIYQVWLRTITPQGTLKAACKRLPDIADLGATIVYLSPVQLQDDDPRRQFWSPRQQKSPTNNPRNPYRVKDYDQIDPEYGTEADLKQ